MKNKIIGILGGMGPEASANLYSKIIKYCQKEFKAIQDTDYPQMIIYNMALKGFDETGIVDQDLVKKQLIEGVKKLEEAGAELIIIACNTVHLFYNEMQSTVKIPILSIIEETKKEVIRSKIKKVGIFASETTNKYNLYQKVLEKEGIKTISPNKKEQKIMNEIIEKVMGGNQSEVETNQLNKIAKNYEGKGAEAIILGCTEIPLAINQSQTKVKLFDTLQILGEAGVNYSFE